MFGQPMWYSRYVDWRDHGSLHHPFASLSWRYIRVCLEMSLAEVVHVPIPDAT